MFKVTQLGGRDEIRISQLERQWSFHPVSTSLEGVTRSFTTSSYRPWNLLEFFHVPHVALEATFWLPVFLRTLLLKFLLGQRTVCGHQTQGGPWGLAQGPASCLCFVLVPKGGLWLVRHRAVPCAREPENADAHLSAKHSSSRCERAQSPRVFSLQVSRAHLLSPHIFPGPLLPLCPENIPRLPFGLSPGQSSTLKLGRGPWKPLEFRLPSHQPCGTLSPLPSRLSRWGRLGEARQP